MKISTILLIALATVSAKADLLDLFGTQTVDGCSDDSLKVFVTKCVENEVLLKSNKKIYYYQPPEEGKDEVCNRSMKLKTTVTEECAPVELFDEPAITSITSFSNEKFEVTPYLDIKCELEDEDDKKKEVKDCKSWLIKEDKLVIGDVTTTDKDLVGKTVKASLTLNIRPDEVILDKVAVFSYNGENGFQFAVNGKNQLTMSEAEFNEKETYGYGATITNDSRNLTWSFMSKLKKEGDEDENKVYALIDAIGINGATVLTVEDAKKEPVKPTKTTEKEDKDEEEKTTDALSDEENTENAEDEEATETADDDKDDESDKTENEKSNEEETGKKSEDKTATHTETVTETVTKDAIETITGTVTETVTGTATENAKSTAADSDDEDRATKAETTIITGTASTNSTATIITNVTEKEAATATTNATVTSTEDDSESATEIVIEHATVTATVLETATVVETATAEEEEETTTSDGEEATSSVED